MTKEEQKLLLKDLCSRLPYGVVLKCVDPNFKDYVDWKLIKIDIEQNTVVTTNEVWNDEYLIENIKPYLRSMSSMTQEERDNFQQCLNIIENENYGDGWSPAAWGQMAEFIHYCNEHHLDYNGLIAMGLALEAPEGMY